MNTSFDLYAELDYINDAYGVVDVQAELDWMYDQAMSILDTLRCGRTIDRLVRWSNIDQSVIYN